MKSAVVFFSLLFLAVFASRDFDSDESDVSTLEGISKRIANGQLAKPGQFPYQVRLSITKRKNGRLVGSLCGGALISNRTVLTAAHCIENAASALLFMGTNKVSGIAPNRVMVGVWSKDFIVHENWNSSSMANDIGLINFQSPIKFNDAVQPINLPRASQVNLDNRMAVIAGFGKMGTNAPTSNDLLFANRRILPAENCMRPFRAYFRTNMHICVDGSNKTSTCPGDSGGPLVVQDADGSKAVVGLTSFGGLSCDSGLPVAFTRVTTHLNWIHKHSGIPIRK